ncbi:MAG: phosphoglycerate mutase family protein, partial [Candidatus Andersenbacteria bacterium]
HQSVDKVMLLPYYTQSPFFLHTSKEGVSMAMPLDLVLVRHGESEGNIANQRSRAGDNSAFTPEFKERIGAMWRLTKLGRAQALAAGEWIQSNIGQRFDRYYVSEYIRAKETAAFLKLPLAEWFCDFYLRERDWGEMDVCPDDERQRLFAESLRRRQVDGFFWTPPNGESLAQLCLRVDRVIDTWQRECSDKRIIAVCHGEVMWAFRVRLERLSQQRFRELDTSRHAHDRIHNCQILHYTRRSPVTDTTTPYYSWMRSICPTDLSMSRNEWERIERTRFSNQELIQQVEQVPQLVS